MASFKNQYTMDDAKQIPMNLSPYLRFEVRQLKGWGSDFIIAGEFIHDVLGNCKRLHLDFYIFSKAGFNTLLDFYISSPGHTYKYTINMHYIEIIGPDNIVRLINAIGLTPIDIMNGMEVEMLCCFYDGECIYQFPGCEDAIDTWTVVHTRDASNCCINTILRAIEQDYKISREILEEFDIVFNNKPHIQSCAGLSKEDTEDVMDFYDDELYEYMCTAIKPTDEDMHYLYERKMKQNFQMQGITVYHAHMAKSFLSYIYKHPIKDKLTSNENINCGCFTTEVYMQDSVLSMCCIIVEEKEKELERPPAPSRPPPMPTTNTTNI